MTVWVRREDMSAGLGNPEITVRSALEWSIHTYDLATCPKSRRRLSHGLIKEAHEPEKGLRATTISPHKTHCIRER